MKVISVKFYRSGNGNEPVREWLLDLPESERRAIGTQIKTIEFGWPIGMPLVKSLGDGLWEVRVTFVTRIARVIFTMNGADMVLLHGFIKKSQKTPKADLKVAKDRKREVHRG
ncbi:MAG: hypothetical protein CMP06_08175 [Xanthomonadales bacterium]|nr:hypothetical protein [Xanthomonadales bacterium]